MERERNCLKEGKKRGSREHKGDDQEDVFAGS
jgi:hypothetical protein